MRTLHLLLLALLFSSQLAFSQSNGINFQGIARNASGEPLVNQKITLRFAVIQSTESGTVEYQETKEITSNGQGMFSVVIGDGVFLTKTGNFTDINWKLSPKFLKVELDPQGGTNFALMGTSRLQAVPFAYYANGVDAENVQGVLPAVKGGTGVASISALKGALQLDQVSNTSDANKPLSMATQSALATKVDKVQGKDLSTNDYTTAEKTKLAAITGTNTGDQDLSGLATTTALATKANSTEVAAALATKVDKVQGKELSTNDYTTAEKTKLAAITGTNTGDQDLSGLATTTALATKANTTDVTTALATKVDKVQGKELSTNDYTTAEKTKLAAITGTNTGDQDLSGYATTAALNAKANSSEVTAALATKVDKVQGKELSTNDYTTAEKTKLAAITGTNTGDQDLSGYATTAALATKASTTSVTAGLDLKENIANKSTAVDLGGTSPSDLLYPTQKAVKTYVAANAAAGGIADGGISTIKLADGAVTDVKVAAGISKSKVGLGNVENTALSTWVGSSSLSTVGNITSGVWNGTPINYSRLNLTNSIVNNDVVDSTLTMSKLAVTKQDLTLLGLAPDEELIIYQAGRGLLANTVVTPNGRRSGSPVVTTNFDVYELDSISIRNGGISNADLDFGIDPSKVGLGNVNNTSDAAKPISNATQIALDLKANSSDLTTALSLKANLNAPTFTGTVSGITKAMVGLGNVDNTSDAGKPISTATQVALDLKANASDVATKAPLNSPTFTGTVSGITKSMVGLGNVDNTTDAGKPISTATQTALDLKANNSDLGLKANLNSPTFTGTVSGITKSMVGLGNVDNTTDAGKPISTATQSALDLKAPLNSPTFTGTVSGITKGMVGLGNVENTSDAAKPISTATQNALNLKADAADVVNGLSLKAPLNSPTFTGTVSGVTKNMVGLGNVENTALSTWVGSNSLQTVGTITTGTWNGSSLTVAYGGTGATSLTANNILLGNGTNPLQVVAPGSSGNVLTSNGTTWVSQSPGAAAAGTLTGNALAANVVSSSLTSVGTLTSLSSGNVTSTGKIIAGSNTASSSSAILEANSTTQGFLPPRMTAAQRNAISSPASGLVVWCNNCGANGELQVFGEDKSWRNLSGNTAAAAYTPTIGESYKGGVVAYVLQNGDPGYEANTPHGIIAATVDQSPVIVWASPPLSTLNNGNAIGLGLANTAKIITAHGTNNAAGKAIEYRGGGYSDWYLPSRDELRKLLAIQNTINLSGFYWTSSESTSVTNEAIYLRTDDPISTPAITKTVNIAKVRAIRSF